MCFITEVLWGIIIFAMAFAITAVFSDYHGGYTDIPKGVFSTASKTVLVVAGATRSAVGERRQLLHGIGGWVEMEGLKWCRLWCEEDGGDVRLLGGWNARLVGWSGGKRKRERRGRNRRRVRRGSGSERGVPGAGPGREEGSCGRTERRGGEP